MMAAPASAAPETTPAGTGPAGPARSKRRQRLLLIVGGAGALLLLTLLARSRSQQQQAGQGGAVLGAPPAPASDGTGTGGLDNASQLAAFETAIQDQLPQSISTAVQAGLANGFSSTPAAGAGTSFTDVAGSLGSILGFQQGTLQLAGAGSSAGPGGASSGTKPRAPSGQLARPVVHAGTGGRPSTYTVAGSKPIVIPNRPTAAWFRSHPVYAAAHPYAASHAR